jgi:ankyrin repeat protein
LRNPVFAEDKYKKTALQYAQENNHEESVKILTAAVNEQAAKGFTASGKPGAQKDAAAAEGGEHWECQCSIA